VLVEDYRVDQLEDIMVGLTWESVDMALPLMIGVEVRVIRYVIVPSLELRVEVI